MKFLEEESEIIRGSTSLENPCTCGVYFLIDGEEIVYVGKSTACESRVNVHIKDPNKKFDRYKIIPLDEPLISEAEALYILKFTPKYNRKLYPIKSYLVTQLKDEEWSSLPNCRIQVTMCLINSELHIPYDELMTVLKGLLKHDKWLDL